MHPGRTPYLSSLSTLVRLDPFYLRPVPQGQASPGCGVEISGAWLCRTNLARRTVWPEIVSGSGSVRLVGHCRRWFSPFMAAAQALNLPPLTWLCLRLSSTEINSGGDLASRAIVLVCGKGAPPYSYCPVRFLEHAKSGPLVFERVVSGNTHNTQSSRLSRSGGEKIK